MADSELKVQQDASSRGAVLSVRNRGDWKSEIAAISNRRDFKSLRFPRCDSLRFPVISSDTTLPAVMFAGAAPAGQKAIQFKVDYSLQTLSADSAHVAGNFQGWDPAKSQMVNFDGVYRYIAYVGKTDSTYFKFLNGNTWSDVESVPSTCQASTAGFLQALLTFLNHKKIHSQSLNSTFFLSDVCESEISGSRI